MSNKGTTYVNVPTDLFGELCQLIWSADGYVRAKGSTVNMLADKSVFYSINEQCLAMLRKGPITPEERLVKAEEVYEEVGPRTDPVEIISEEEE